MAGHMSVYRLTDSRNPDADIMSRCVWEGNFVEPADDEIDFDLDEQDTELLPEVEVQWGINWQRDLCLAALDGDHSHEEQKDTQMHNLSAATE